VVISATQNIYLIGMMGSWKTTVGKKVAKQRDINFIDIDLEIEKESKMTITEIFNLLGEQKFRSEETRILKMISKQSGNIISTGGGIIIQSENRHILKEAGYTIFLNASPEVLASRIKNSTKRPVLNSSQPMTEQFSNIWESRKDWYYSTADLTLETDELTSNDVSEKIIDLLFN
jgi:shikimate kinase